MVSYKKRVIWFVITKRLNDLSYQKGYVVCHTKSPCCLSHEKGHMVCHTKRFIRSPISILVCI